MEVVFVREVTLLLYLLLKEEHRQGEEQEDMAMPVTAAMEDSVMADVITDVMAAEVEAVIMGEVMDIGIMLLSVLEQAVRRLFQGIADVMLLAGLQRRRILSIPDNLFIIPVFILAIPL